MTTAEQREIYITISIHGGVFAQEDLPLDGMNLWWIVHPLRRVHGKQYIARTHRRIDSNGNLSATADIQYYETNYGDPLNPFIFKFLENKKNHVHGLRVPIEEALK